MKVERGRRRLNRKTYRAISKGIEKEEWEALIDFVMSLDWTQLIELPIKNYLSGNSLLVREVKDQKYSTRDDDEPTAKCKMQQKSE